MQNLRESIRGAVLEVLGRFGPLTTGEQYGHIQRLLPQLCDNEVDCRYCKVPNEPEWKHILRWAQQDLKKSGEIELVGGKWHIRNRATTLYRVQK
jgi:hypothetical protein